MRFSGLDVCALIVSLLLALTLMRSVDNEAARKAERAAADATAKATAKATAPHPPLTLETTPPSQGSTKETYHETHARLRAEWQLFWTCAPVPVRAGFFSLACVEAVVRNFGPGWRPGPSTAPRADAPRHKTIYPLTSAPSKRVVRSL